MENDWWWQSGGGGDINLGGTERIRVLGPSAGKGALGFWVWCNPDTQARWGRQKLVSA